MWIDEHELTNPAASAARKRGRPCIYADAVIQMLLGLKQVFHLSLRALQDFARSQRDLAFSGLPVPNYATTLSRRAQKLEVIQPAPRGGEPLHLVIDSTGLSCTATANGRCTSTVIRSAVPSARCIWQ
jgi:hypothetical protein